MQDELTFWQIVKGVVSLVVAFAWIAIAATLGSKFGLTGFIIGLAMLVLAVIASDR